MGVYLETERMVLRDHRPEDLPTHHELMSDNRAMYYLQDIMTHSLEESKDNLWDALRDQEQPDRRFYFLRMEDRNRGAHIGEIGYTVHKVTPMGKRVDLGYFLRRDAWGRGYATEALKELMRWAFEENDVYRLTTGCLVENAASERVMIKCGLIKEGEFPRWTWHDGRMKDRVQYRLLREEWNARAHGE